MRFADAISGQSWLRDEIKLSNVNFVRGLLATHLVALIAIYSAPIVPSILTTPFIVLTLSFVPGSLFLMVIADNDRIDLRWVVYAFGTSLMLLMLLGLVINILLPLIGIDRPLSKPPLVVSITMLVAVLAFGALISKKRTSEMTAVELPLSPVPLSLAVLPFLSIYGVTMLNRTGENWLLLVALVVIALLPLMLALSVDSKWHGFGIWMIALAVVYHDALFIGKTFPGNPVVVRVWQAQRWIPGIESGGALSSELLQHGTIFPMFAVLNDLFILDQMLLVNPLFVSFIPVALFVAYRAYIDPRLAMLAASAFVFAHPFYNQFPTAGRSATPVLFLALFAVTLSESEFRMSIRSGLAILFLSGVVFTHYGTSYFFLASVAIASVGYFGIGYLDSIIGRINSSTSFVRREIADFNVAKEKPSGLLSWPLRGFYLTLTFGWYLYTNDARAFALFPRHFSRVLGQFLAGEIGAGAGRTGARLQRDYGSVAIETSKQFYVILGLLMIIGISVTLYQRFYRAQRYRFNDHALILGIVMLGLFGLTIIAETWGGGRPMMITFVFTLVFVGVALDWFGQRLTTIRNRLPLSMTESASRTLPVAAMAVFLVLLFILNSGVATALVLPGSAPSNVPTSDANPNTQTDVAAHVWLIEHRTAAPVYGDNVAFGQTDWLLPNIVARTEVGTRYVGSKPGEIKRLTRAGADQGYLILLGHNLATGELSLYLETRPLEDIQPMYRENRVYSTGYSELYYIE